MSEVQLTPNRRQHSLARSQASAQVGNSSGPHAIHPPLQLPSAPRGQASGHFLLLLEAQGPWVVAEGCFWKTQHQGRGPSCLCHRDCAGSGRRAGPRVSVAGVGLARFPEDLGARRGAGTGRESRGPHPSSQPVRRCPVQLQLPGLARSQGGAGREALAGVCPFPDIPWAPLGGGMCQGSWEIKGILMFWGPQSLGGGRLGRAGQRPAVGRGSPQAPWMLSQPSGGRWTSTGQCPSCSSPCPPSCPSSPWGPRAQCQTLPPPPPAQHSGEPVSTGPQGPVVVPVSWAPSPWRPLWYEAHPVPSSQWAWALRCPKAFTAPPSTEPALFCRC